MKSIEPKQFQKRYEKAISHRRRWGLFTINREKYKTSSIRNILNISREPYYSKVGKRFNTIINKSKRRNQLRTEDNIPKKIIEIFIMMQMMNFMEKNKIMMNHQFMGKKKCGV